MAALPRCIVHVGVLRDPPDTRYAFGNRLMQYATPSYATPSYAAGLAEGWRDVLVYGFSLPGHFA